MKWHPTGDDGTVGTADHYDLRYRTDHAIVTTDDWDTATPYTYNLPYPPKAYSATVWEGGSLGYVIVAGLDPDTIYYFGLKAVDEAGNASPVATDSGPTTHDQDVISPDPVTDLAVSNIQSGQVTLTWKASGDDYIFDNATSYQVRYIAASAGTMTEDQWFWTATKVPCALTPQAYGSTETFDVTGLNANTTYYFAVRAVDEQMNWGSRVVMAPITTLTASDSTAPAAIADLAASKPSRGSVRLTWTAPGDDSSTGTATTYDIRYSTSTITTGNWDTATQVTGEPAPQVAGTVQTMDVRGLSPNQTYYFAMKTADETPNWSGVSNCPAGVHDPDDQRA